MPIAENEAIEITVLSGHGEPGVFALPGGTARNPFGVGSAGEWRIAGNGVAPIHFYFAFDGRELFVVPAAPQLPVLLAGVALGTQWARVELPCELRFAGACLVLRAVPRISGTMTGPVSTMSDGGALRKAAERAVAAAQRVSASGGADAGPAMAPGGGSGSGMGPELFSTMILPNRPHLPPHAVDARGGSTRPPAATPVPARAPSPVPPPPDPRAAPTGASAPPPPAVKTGEGDETKKGYWQTASPVKKASLVMAPFALGLAYWMLQDPPPAPPPKVLSNVHKTSDARAALDAGGPAPSASAQPRPEGSAAAGIAPAPSDAPARAAIVDAGPTAHPAGPDAAPIAPAPASAPAPKKGPTPLAVGKRTADRQALDAVENGSFDEAAKEYADLATAHADVPAYKDAARILQDKASRGR